MTTILKIQVFLNQGKKESIIKEEITTILKIQVSHNQGMKVEMKIHTKTLEFKITILL
jgi:hypothetical protein